MAETGVNVICKELSCIVLLHLDETIIRSCDNMPASSVKGYAVHGKLVAPHSLVVLHMPDTLLCRQDAVAM